MYGKHPITVHDDFISRKPQRNLYRGDADDDTDDTDIILLIL